MASAARLEKAFRATSAATFVASFGFTLSLVTFYCTRTTAWGQSLAYAIFAPFLILYVVALILMFCASRAYVKSGDRTSSKALFRPFRWVLAGHLSFMLQALVIGALLDRLKTH